MGQKKTTIGKKTRKTELSRSLPAAIQFGDKLSFFSALPILHFGKGCVSFFFFWPCCHTTAPWSCPLLPKPGRCRACVRVTGPTGDTTRMTGADRERNGAKETGGALIKAATDASGKEHRTSTGLYFLSKTPTYFSFPRLARDGC